jgi:hypothetical protein
MDSSNKTSLPKLNVFNNQDFFQTDIDFTTVKKLPMAELNENGIKLVSEYYAHKYQMPHLTITADEKQFIKVFNSEDFSQTRNTKENIRIPFTITNIHSTPIVYIKENSKEALLVLDSRGSDYAPTIAKALKLDVYTCSDTRQRDMYSCHTDTLVVLRELTGKNKNADYLIPNILAKLDNEKRISPHSAQIENLKEIQLFDRLRITTQRQLVFLNRPPDGNEIVHQHSGENENIHTFLNRYPADEANAGTKEKISNFLREKGLKYTQIIEIQFYLNQLKTTGIAITEDLTNNFIQDAKKEFKIHGKRIFFSNASGHLNHLAQKYLAKYFKADEPKEMIMNLDKIITKNKP